MANRTVYSHSVDVSIVSRSVLALPSAAVSGMAARASNRKAFVDIVLFPPLCIVAEVNRERVAELVRAGGNALAELIRKPVPHRV